MVSQGKERFDWSNQATEVQSSGAEDRTSLSLDPWLCERPLVSRGRSLSCRELLLGPQQGLRTVQREPDFYKPLLETAFLEGADLVYALGTTAESCSLLQRLGFEKKATMVRRRRYLGVSALSRHSNGSRFGIRGVAKVSRQIRNRLIETSLGPESFLTIASVFGDVASSLELGFDRPLTEIRRRYSDVSSDWGILFLRRRVGEAKDSFVIFRESVDDKGRRIMTLVDYWTKDLNRRSSLWLMGEISLWALAVGFDVVDTILVQGSTEEKVFMALGGLRKKESTPVWVKTAATAQAIDFSQANLRASDFAVPGFGV